MPTTVVKSIGNGTRDYTSFQAWEDACPANLVTNDQIWEGQVYPEGSGTNGEWVFTTTVCGFAGTTCDATRFLRLRAAPGQSFADNANKATNALRYNRANGVAISWSGQYTYCLDVFGPVVEVVGLQFKRTGGPRPVVNSSSGSARVVGCISETSGGGSYSGGSLSLYNCVHLATGTASAIGDLQNSAFRNCTIVNTGTGSANLLQQGNYSTGVLLKNTLILGFTGITNRPISTGVDTTNSSNVASDLSSLGWTNNNLTSRVIADEVVSTTGGSEDLRLKSGNTVGAAGVRDQTYTNDLDIVGRSRSTTTPSIGAWESASGTTGNLTLVATDAQDTAALGVTVTVGLTASPTDAQDTTSLGATVTVAGTLVATDTQDTAALNTSLNQATLNAALVATDPQDTAALAAGVTVSGLLIATDTQDSAATFASVTVSALLAAVDAQDTTTLGTTAIVGASLLALESSDFTAMYLNMDSGMAGNAPIAGMMANMGTLSYRM